MSDPHPLTDPLIVDPEVDHIRGSSSGPLTLIEYGDFECPACRQMDRAISMLMVRFGASIRFVFRNFPLVEIHPGAELAAEAAEAAAAQGQFWEFHDQLFALSGGVNRERVATLAAELGLDLERFNDNVEERAFLDHVTQQVEGGRRAGVRATPTFFLDGRLIDTSFGIQRLEEAIAARLS